MFTKDLDAAAHAVRGLVADLDPDAIPLCEVLAAWKMFNAIERDAASAKTLLARRVEDGNTWRSAGFRSAAEQLAAIAGIVGHDREEGDRDLQAGTQAAEDRGRDAQGKLSPAKAEAIADAAAVAPDAEDELLDGAEKKPLGELREECLKAKAVDVDKTRERIHRERCARVHKDGEGAWNLYARGSDRSRRRVHGDVAAVDRRAVQARPGRGPRRTARGVRVRRADETRRRSPASQPSPSSPSRPSRRSTEPPRSRSATPAKYLALIRLDYEALVRGAVEGEETCEIAGLGPIPVRIARDLLGDAILKLVITKGVDVANVTHLGRSPTVAQRVALLVAVTRVHQGRLHPHPTARERPPRRLGRNETHATRRARPVLRHDHDLKTYHGWALVEGTGKRPMVPPDDPRHPNYRAPPDQP